jgi:hypothetical protein
MHNTTAFRMWNHDVNVTWSINRYVDSAQTLTVCIICVGDATSRIDRDRTGSGGVDQLEVQPVGGWQKDFLASIDLQRGASLPAHPHELGLCQHRCKIAKLVD